MNKIQNSEDTIAALATPIGAGGIGIIRISGPCALKIGSKLFSKNLIKVQTHTAVFGKISDTGVIIDEGLALVMRSPNSYTGEDTIELQCHGSPLILDKVLCAAVNYGCRIANPGEFTQRAFLNGKIDLTKAEAIQQLISSKNIFSLNTARRNFEGGLKEKVSGFQKTILDVCAELEAWIDFPDEDLSFEMGETLCEKVKALIRHIESFKNTYSDGALIENGFSICLIGAPNVGKSSLLNTLSKKNCAIVTEIAGTTRDTLHEEIAIGELHCRVLDTAGIRSTDNIIEKEGIERAKKAAKNADVVIALADINNPYFPKFPYKDEKTIFALNKADMKAPRSNPEGYLEISAKTGKGIELLKNHIKQKVLKHNSLGKEDLILTNKRHYDAIDKSLQSLIVACNGLQSYLSPEFIISDLRVSLSELNKIIGIDISEELLSNIFSKFCVGK